MCGREGLALAGFSLSPPPHTHLDLVGREEACVIGGKALRNNIATRSSQGERCCSGEKVNGSGWRGGGGDGKVHAGKSGDGRIKGVKVLSHCSSHAVPVVYSETPTW